MNRRCLPEPPGVVVGSTPVLWGGGLASSSVSLCSGVSSVRRFGFISACCSGTPVACSAGISVVCCLGNPLACCSGTSSLPLDCSSTCVLREGACVLGEGATGASSSSDHSITMIFRVRVVWSPSSEMPPSLRGAVAAVFLFFWAGSSTAALLTLGEDSPSDQHPHLRTPKKRRRNFL